MPKLLIKSHKPLLCANLNIAVKGKFSPSVKYRSAFIKTVFKTLKTDMHTAAPSRMGVAFWVDFIDG